MTLSIKEQADLKMRAWKNRAKGKGVRWRMLRDTVSVVSSNWLTSYQVETCMIRIWGLTRKKTKELIEELVEMGDLLVEKDEKTQDMKYYLNRERARFWLGDQMTKAIPAGLVQAVILTLSASRSEV